MQCNAKASLVSSVKKRSVKTATGVHVQSHLMYAPTTLFFLAVLSLGKLCEDHGYTCHWTSSQKKKTHLIRNGKRIGCKRSNYIPFLVLGLSASSSPTAPSPTSSSSSSQDSVLDVNRYTENPVPERSGNTSEKLRGDPLHETTETEKMGKQEKYKEIYRMNCRIGYRNSDRTTSTEPW